MLTASFRKTILQQIPQASHYYIGFSGGVDSHVLLHLLAREFKQQGCLSQLTALHIDHGWHADSHQWAQHCVMTSEQLGIKCEVIKVNAKPDQGESWEAYAREARYTVFARFITKNTCLLTAHQRDDQAETFLLQLFRGAGVRGLSAMPMIASFSKGMHVRPLLNTSREDMLAYAAEEQLRWIEDASNSNLNFDRNFIRQEIIPQIKQRWPAINNILARSAIHCADAQKILTQVALNNLLTVQGSRENTLSITALKQFDAEYLRNVLRQWIQLNQVKPPSDVQLQHIIHDVIQTNHDRQATVSWSHYEIRRFRDDLFITAKKTQPLSTIHWQNISQPLVIPEVGTLSVKSSKGVGLNPHLLKDTVITVGFRRNGERCQPMGRQGSHPLKKLFQEWNVPSWERSCVPLIFVNSKLAAVVGYCICTEFAVKNSDEEGWMIERNGS